MDIVRRVHNQGEQSPPGKLYKKNYNIKCLHKTARRRKQVIKLITKIRLFKYIENFITENWKFSDKSYDIFHMSAQNIDCGYSLEPPHRVPTIYVFEQK